MKSIKDAVEVIREIVSSLYEDKNVDFSSKSLERYFETMDSLRFMEFIVQAENVLDIEVNQDVLQVENLNSLDKVVELISKYIVQKEQTLNA